MKRNLGNTDRIWRFIFGLFLLYIWNYGTTNNIVRTIILVLGVIAVLESIIGFCYFYKLMGINTQKKRR